MGNFVCSVTCKMLERNVEAMEKVEKLISFLSSDTLLLTVLLEKWWNYARGNY
jgi:hypothetical protein